MSESHEASPSPGPRMTQSLKVSWKRLAQPNKFHIWTFVQHNKVHISYYDVLSPQPWHAGRLRHHSASCPAFELSPNGGNVNTTAKDDVCRSAHNAHTKLEASRSSDPFMPWKIGPKSMGARSDVMLTTAVRAPWTWPCSS